MDDLVAWLRAQLDEDERVARAAAAEGGPDWTPDSTWLHDLIDPLPSQRRAHPERAFLLTQEDAEHIALHDPARVLREVEAKRRRVERFAQIVVDPINYPFEARSLARDMLELETEPYVDRPGYRESWRP